jgi:penicillin amidase
VDVYRDAHGVPQLYADNADDLFRAQGYVHAQDRFWEMDFRRHVTAGRLAELFGKSQVKTDAFIRTMGWRRTAAEEFKLLAPDTQRYLRAYADGVNAWIGEHSGPTASLEHGLLKLTNDGYRIAKWDPVDSVAWLKAMAWDLRSNMVDELGRAQLLAEGLGRDQIEDLYPPYPEDRHATILPAGGVVGGAFDATAPTSQVVAGATPPAEVTSALLGGGAAGRLGGGGGGDDGAAAALGAVRDGLSSLPALLGQGGDGIGSNSWVVAGSRTKSGKPLLANDPHLGPALPSVWYQMGLHCKSVSPDCPFDVAGYTFSGAPGVVIGHNARIAWGFTNLGPDVADLFLEKVTGDQYEMDGGKIPLQTRTETIRVAGGKSVEITIRSTAHGPLLSDRNEDFRQIGKNAPVAGDGAPASEDQQATSSYGVALRWTALEPSRTYDAIIGLNTATDWKSFREAARLFAVPAQNMIYADVDGNIGYQAPGSIPVRQSGDGRWPVPGWLTKYEWRGRVPFEQLPHVLNPPDGYVVTANQAVVRSTYPHLITADWDYGYRSQRIRALVAAAGKDVDAADFEKIQADTYNANAARLAPELLAVTAPERLTPARNLLRRWDYSQPAESAAAAFFNATWRHLLQRTFDELPADAKPDGGGRWFEVMRGLLEKPSSPWWDDKRTADPESRDEVLVGAMDDAVRELTRRFGDNPEAWQWGKLHTLELRNPAFGASGVGAIEWLLNRGPYEVDGGGSIVNATGWNASRGYDVYWVPSMRMVVDLGDLDRSRWINLTGASGHTFHRDYTSQVELWRQGRTTPMRWKRSTIESDAEHHLTLKP